jgi:hypothetical protein
MSENSSIVSQGTADSFGKEGITDALRLIGENLAGQDVNILDLPRIHMPGGGAVEFRVDSAAGEYSARNLAGHIVAFRRGRIFWREALGRGGKRPPDCTSIDGCTGVGDPGGDCKRCTFARYGSALNADGSAGNGQACKEVFPLLVRLPEDTLPHLLTVPPTSIKNFKRYLVALTAAGAQHWDTMTEFALEKRTSEQGIAYGQIVFRMGQRLDPEQAEALKPYHRRMLELLAPSPMDSVYDLYENNRPAAQAANAEDRPDNEVPY